MNKVLLLVILLSSFSLYAGDSSETNFEIKITEIPYQYTEDQKTDHQLKMIISIQNKFNAKVTSFKTAKKPDEANEATVADGLLICSFMDMQAMVTCKCTDKTPKYALELCQGNDKKPVDFFRNKDTLSSYPSD